MNTSMAKRATSIRLNRDLYNRIEKLAKKEHRSINNFIEIVLEKATALNRPNAETIKAMEELQGEKSSLKGYTDVNKLFKDLLDD